MIKEGQIFNLKNYRILKVDMLYISLPTLYIIERQNKGSPTLLWTIYEYNTLHDQINVIVEIIKLNIFR